MKKSRCLPLVSAILIVCSVLCVLCSCGESSINDFSFLTSGRFPFQSSTGSSASSGPDESLTASVSSGEQSSEESGEIFSDTGETSAGTPTPSTGETTPAASSSPVVTSQTPPSTVSIPTEDPTVTPEPTPTPPPTATPEPTLPPDRRQPDSYIVPGCAQPSFCCGQSFIYDVDNCRFLYLNGNEKTVCPASTTKLLTILYARTLLEPDLKVTPGDELDLVGANSSLAYIRNDKGHVLTVEQLIEGMLLPSGNDAAHVLAAAGGRAIDPSVRNGKEAVAVFMEGMNRYAHGVLGLVGSNFITPDGYHQEGHYSTLEDMAIVSREAYKDELIRKYAAMTSDNVVYASGHMMTWTNTNWCIDPYSPEYYVPEMNGLKTGAKEKGYYCFIGSAVIKGRNFVFGFFGEEIMANRFVDAKTAVGWIKDNFF